MGILGNHTSTSGITWQFKDSTKNLEIGFSTSGSSILVDYTNYYDKYTDIVITYKNNVLTAYLDGVKYKSLESISLVANGNLYIGSSLQWTDRGMKGYLPYVKIWNKALTDSQVNSLNLEQTETQIEPSNILRELDLTTITKLKSSGTLANNNYQLYIISQ